MQQTQVPDGFMQIEAETVQNQAVTPIAIPAVQGVDTEQPKVVYSQDAQEPDGNEPIDQSDLGQGNHAGRLTEHSARMAEVRGVPQAGLLCRRRLKCGTIAGKSRYRMDTANTMMRV